MRRIIMSTKTLNSKVLVIALSMTLINCNKSVDSFSLLADENTFKQQSSYGAHKIDILWVIDNSGSMGSSQTNVKNNFKSFISSFINQNLDFHMAVTSTEAYQVNYANNLSYSNFKDGSGSNHSGVFVMDKNTPNLESVFTTNVAIGTTGSGDERAFSSFQAALTNTNNAAFRRSDAFLAVIIVSDEDDFSHTDWQNGYTSYFYTENYNDSKLDPISNYTQFLDTLTSSSASNKKYSVNTISIQDAQCQSDLNTTFSGRKIAKRYASLADATNGIKASLCGDFASSLQDISKNIIELASQFKLNREPVASSISVIVNGASVPQDPINGWTYDASTWTISFHGTAVPASDAIIKINFDPVTVKQ